ncbi:hypothetical protein NEMBOFW57_007838 [Staphylotrichum longicolle]|uniref:Uncharacterized protein n=1 Tax=Staphylotrichum longicolle TaxID=669026 RepID=A0AAD4EYY5_9PEZI|nr:hypothetical protein NEMBOFW57_007838 [Staphylotrichum longicolle]
MDLLTLLLLSTVLAPVSSTPIIPSEVQGHRPDGSPTSYGTPSPPTEAPMKPILVRREALNIASPDNLSPVDTVIFNPLPSKGCTTTISETYSYRCSWDGTTTMYPSTTVLFQQINCNGCDNLLVQQDIYLCPNQRINGTLRMGVPSTSWSTRAMTEKNYKGGDFLNARPAPTPPRGHPKKKARREGPPKGFGSREDVEWTRPPPSLSPPADHFAMETPSDSKPLQLGGYVIRHGPSTAPEFKIRGRSLAAPKSEEGCDSDQEPALSCNLETEFVTVANNIFAHVQNMEAVILNSGYPSTHPISRAAAKIKAQLDRLGHVYQSMGTEVEGMVHDLDQFATREDELKRELDDSRAANFKLSCANKDLADQVRDFRCTAAETELELRRLKRTTQDLEAKHERLEADHRGLEEERKKMGAEKLCLEEAVRKQGEELEKAADENRRLQGLVQKRDEEIEGLKSDSLGLQTLVHQRGVEAEKVWDFGAGAAGVTPLRRFAAALSESHGMDDDDDDGSNETGGEGLKERMARECGDQFCLVRTTAVASPDVLGSEQPAADELSSSSSPNPRIDTDTATASTTDAGAARETRDIGLLHCGPDGGEVLMLDFETRGIRVVDCALAGMRPNAAEPRKLDLICARAGDAAAGEGRAEEEELLWTAAAAPRDVAAFWVRYAMGDV